MYDFLSDIVVIIHFIFVIFAVAGGVLCIWWRKIVWFHLPAALWAAVISFAGWICPLTYVENWFRLKAGGAGYPEGFIAKYIEPILYPADLTQYHQIISGVTVIVFNLIIYGYIFKPIGRFFPKRKTM